MTTGNILEIHIAEPGAKVLPHLVHTGLRAAILSSGTIRVGDVLASDQGDADLRQHPVR